jgi:hypothetical protein
MRARHAAGRACDPPPPRAEGTRAAGRAGVDEPSLLEAIDQGGAEDGVEDRAHGQEGGVCNA